MQPKRYFSFCRDFTHIHKVILNELWVGLISELSHLTGVNQSNSERVQEPLQTLAKNESKRFKFGILAGSKISMDGMVLKIGSEVKIIPWKSLFDGKQVCLSDTREYMDPFQNN